MREVYEWIRAFALAGIVAVLLLLVIRPTMVKGDSMEPTLEHNNYLIIEQVGWRMEGFSRGDIIVFTSDLLNGNGEQRDLIKRVIGIPGDHIQIGDGRVYVNEAELEEPYVRQQATRGDVDLVVDEGEVFVLGDNRAVSLDSRNETVGTIPYEDIRGKVLVRLLPASQIGFVE